MPDAAAAIWPWMHLAGRALFSCFVILFGIRYLFALRSSREYLHRKGIPGPLPVSLAVGTMLTVGGTFVLLGWHRFIGAGLLFLVLFPAAWALHPFWTENDPRARHDQMGYFFQTLGLAGAALFIAFYGGTSWPLSLGN